MYQAGKSGPLEGKFKTTSGYERNGPKIGITTTTTTTTNNNNISSTSTTSTTTTTTNNNNNNNNIYITIGNDYEKLFEGLVKGEVVI